MWHLLVVRSSCGCLGCRAVILQGFLWGVGYRAVGIQDTGLRGCGSGLVLACPPVPPTHV